MTMPGAPILYYGDEIGMGDNIYLGDRNGVRTPMQWSPDRNGGFSRADPQRLYLPPVMDPIYGYEAVNVEAQLRNPSSLLHWTRRLVATRRGYQAFGRGTIAFLEPGNRKILAYVREHGDEAILCVANLSRVPQAVELDLARFEGRVPVELLGQEPFPPVGKLPYLFTLAGHGYMAFRLARDAKPPGWHEERLVTRRIPVLVLAANWQQVLDRAGAAPQPGEFFVHASHERLRDEVLLPYLRQRRWFAARSEPVADTRVTLLAPWRIEGATWSLVFLEVDLAAGGCQRYFIPMGIDWESRSHDPMEKYGNNAIVRVRHRDRVGVFYAAFADSAFTRSVARAMGANLDVPVGPGRLRFSSTAAYGPLAGAIAEEVRVPAVEQSNTAVFFGNRLFLKGYRRMRDGVNPELELGRFLTEVSPFPNIAPVLGAMEYVREGEEPVTLAILQKFIENQGDLWQLTCQHLGNMLAPAHPAATGAESPGEAAAFEFHLRRMALLGRRICELHRALCVTTGDPAFDPEPITQADVQAWKATVGKEMDESFAALDAALPGLDAAVREQAAALVQRREALRARVSGVKAPGPQVMKTRFHGDLHLGQVLVAQDDFVIVDFEGEPARSMAERRAKSSVLRDVAGMLRSFSYAAHAARMRRTPGATPTEASLAAVAAWERDAAVHFRDGYRRASPGLASVPQDAAAFQSLLELFLVEKALYELRYELAQRPDWVSIPLRGLLELAGP
jgi:maltose alpha-D-glucosyltransferase/alpha-amylase